VTTLTNVYRVVVHAQPEVAFAYVSDLTRHAEWSGGRLKVEAVSPGPIAVGSQYISHGDVAGQKDRLNHLHVTQYQPPSYFAFVAQDPGFGDVTHEFRFTPQDRGSLIERIVTITMAPLMAFAFRTVIHPLVGKPMMDKALAALKTKLEQPST
jgi:Polyketide cyclase / dehydrase and lipid transport